MIPSGIQRSKDTPLRLQQIRPGLYLVKNAYAGVFEFFRERAGTSRPSTDKGGTKK
jgi:hypothetical protein